MHDFSLNSNYNISDLLKIMEILRSENGCPWDREQNHVSIRQNLLEEAYEAADAIDLNDSDLLCEELGDVLLQVVFHSQMEREVGGFTFDDVADRICKKLIYRHPHIFSDVVAETSEEVLQNWDNLKRKAKNQQTFSDTLHAVPKSFPALMRSQKVGSRAKRAGYDYSDVNGALSDLKSELAELEQAIKAGDKANISEELGDLLFATVNCARHLDVDSEQALAASCDKFIERFETAEGIAGKNGQGLNELNAAQLDELWAKTKAKAKSQMDKL